MVMATHLVSQITENHVCIFVNYGGFIDKKILEINEEKPKVQHCN